MLALCLVDRIRHYSDEPDEETVLRETPMKHIATGLCVTALLGIFIISLTTIPAAAISADLANKCRQMAIKAYPPKPAGSKSGTAEAERKYYQDCISNNGAMPDNQNPPPPAKK